MPYHDYIISNIIGWNSTPFGSKFRLYQAITSCLLFCLLQLGISSHIAIAQQKGQKVYQLSGLVLDQVSGNPIPYTRIVIHKNKRYALANLEGFFSIPVVENDTLYFQCIGYKPARFAVRNYFEQNKVSSNEEYIYAVEYLIPDTTVSLPEIIVHPYDSPLALKTAMLNINAPFRGDYTQVQSNISPELMTYFMNNMPQNESEMQNALQQRYAAMYSQSRLLPAFVDPVAVFNLLRHVNKKNKERREKVLNSTDE